MQKLNFKLRKEIKITNVVCTADLKQIIDIASFNKYKFLSTNLELYKCGYVKDEKMVGRVSVFASGKLISVGTKSPNQASNELKKACRILKNYKLSKSIKIFPKVRNIVGNVDLNKKINLERLVKIIKKSMYEPEQFPGVICKIKGSITALIFASGKIIIVGPKSIEELNSGFFELMNWI